MAVTSSASDSRSPVGSPKEKKSRSKCPGVRVIGGRIYDSDHGITCHQCRQKTRDFAAKCKNQKKDKPCSIKYCHKCLMNRYGENAEQVSLLDSWECPKCRGICNCSFCRKKRGQQPTGILVHTAKENGFSSVSELLNVKGPENFCYKRVAKDASPMGAIADSPIKPRKENSMDGMIDGISQSQTITETPMDKESTKKRKKRLHESNKESKRPRVGEEISENEVKLKKKLKETRKNEVLMMNGISEDCNFAEKHKLKRRISKNNVCLSVNNEEAGKCENDGVPDVAKSDNVTKKKKSTNKRVTVIMSEKIDEDIPLPIATSLIIVAGIEIPNEVAGDALQFFEFCAAFGLALEFKIEQAEAVIREIVTCRKGRRLQGSLLVQFHMKLMSLILEDSGERSPSLSAENDQDSWLKALQKCFSNCNFISFDIPSVSFDGNESYAMLNALQKFKLLNFLCDEALSTNALRSWIDDQNLKFAESKKEAKEKLQAAKDKKKQLKQKVQDEVANVIMNKNGATLSISEHEEIISQIKKEAALAQAEMLEAMGMMAPKRSERCDGVRTDPWFLDDNGRAFWRLKGYNDEPDILLQDMGSWDSVSVEEKWFAYDAEQKEEIEKYISSLRAKRLRAKEVAAIPLKGDIETNLCH